MARRGAKAKEEFPLLAQKGLKAVPIEGDGKYPLTHSLLFLIISYHIIYTG